MATIATTRKSRLHNALEGLALTATLQSFPTFATAAFLLKLCGNHDLVGDLGVAIFVAIASLAHALLAVTSARASPPPSRPSMNQNSTRPICRCPTRSPHGAPTRSPRCN